MEPQQKIALEAPIQRGETKLTEIEVIKPNAGALRGASLLFEQDVQREGQLLFSAQVLVACIDQRRQKPTPIPTQLYSLFESLA